MVSSIHRFSVGVPGGVLSDGIDTRIALSGLTVDRTGAETRQKHGRISGQSQDFVSYLLLRYIKSNKSLTEYRTYDILSLSGKWERRR